MTAALTPFTYDGRQLRTVLVDGDPWFVAADVAAILGYRDASNALRMIDDDDEQGYSDLSTPGGAQRVSVISESGLYTLILRSRHQDGARTFRRWVTHEVLPAIRRTGSYHVPSTIFALPQTLPEALRAYAAEVEAHDATRAELNEAQPKVSAWEAFLSADGYYSMAAVAKVLGYGPNILFKRSRQLGILQGNNLPYQRYAHHFEVVVGTYVDQHGVTHPTYTTKVLPSGLDFLRRKLARSDELQSVSA